MFHLLACWQEIGPHEDLLTIVKRRKLQWYGNVSRSSGLAKTIFQSTVKGGRRQGRQRKRWEDNIREWTGLEFGKSPKGSGELGKMEETGCKIISGAQIIIIINIIVIIIITTIKQHLYSAIFHLQWKRRALYNSTSNTYTTTHTHIHTPARARKMYCAHLPHRVQAHGPLQ